MGRVAVRTHGRAAVLGSSSGGGTALAAAASLCSAQERVLGYVRSYPKAEALKLFLADVAWRKTLAYLPEETLARPPENREAFERLYQAGPVGSDAEGHPVVLERLGAFPP